MDNRIAAGVVWLITAPCAVAAPALGPTPVFPAGTKADVIQGVRVPDPYRALENADDPRVKAWSDAQNTRTRAWLDAVPGRAAVAARLKRLIGQTSPRYYDLQAHGPHVFALYLDPARQQPKLVALNAAADVASRRDLLDPNAVDAGGHTEIDWYKASPDGSKVAVSLSRNGSEVGTLHVYDVGTGHETEAPIPRVQYPTAGGAVAWMPDSGGFWYARYPDASAPAAEQAFNQALYLHRLGTPAAADRRVLGAAEGLPRTAEIYLESSRAGAVASVELGDGGEYQHYVLTPDGKAMQIGRYADHVIGGAVMDDDGTVYAVSRKDAPMGKVLRLPVPYAGDLAAAQTMVPERTDAAVVDGGEFGHPLVLAGSHLFVDRIAGGPSEVTITDLHGGHATVLPLPPVSAVTEIDPLTDGSVLFNQATYLQPPGFMHWQPSTGRVGRTAMAVISPVSFADATVSRVFAVSKDGTRVPVSVIARKGTRLDGKNPLLLYGYGGYGVSTVPGFGGAWVRLWLDAGGVFATANIRGGGEYGERWHRQGMLTNKQNVFDDFDAAAEAMIRLGYTSHQELALLGGSNGGLLMGAMITQHPQLAHAVVSSVGIYDMLRVELDPNGAFNVSEFGSVKDPAQFAALHAYSPYHNVRAGTAYPAVLMMTGATDGRVNPMQSRKFAAALQQATSSGQPILLRTSQTAGHGIGSSLAEQIAQQTDRTMFLFDQLGMDAAAAGR